MSEPLALSVLLTAKPGKGDELAKALANLIEPAFKDKGCLEYSMHRHPTDPNQFMFYEIWESEADLQAHIVMQQKQFGGAHKALLESEIMTRWVKESG